MDDRPRERARHQSSPSTSVLNGNACAYNIATRRPRIRAGERILRWSTESHAGRRREGRCADKFVTARRALAFARSRRPQDRRPTAPRRVLDEIFELVSFGAMTAALFPDALRQRPRRLCRPRRTLRSGDLAPLFTPSSPTSPPPRPRAGTFRCAPPARPRQFAPSDHRRIARGRYGNMRSRHRGDGKVVRGGRATKIMPSAASSACRRSANRARSSPSPPHPPLSRTPRDPAVRPITTPNRSIRRPWR